MKILQVFNNSVVLARDELGREVVLTGRGVGYQARRGDEVDDALVVRVFVPADNPGSVARLLAEIPDDRVELVAELFTDAVRSLGTTVPPLSIIAAADHIHQALQRIERGDVMEYQLRSEVAHLHPDELRVAEALVARLNDRLETQLPAGEAIALAMHLFHASTGSATMEQTYVQSALIKQIFGLVGEHFGPAFDVESIDAARFAAHLRYFFARARKGLQLEGDAPSVGVLLRTHYPQSYQLAQRIRALLELRLSHPVSEDEVVYLTMHVVRLQHATAS